ncbi:P-loop containing nucleoside triphosphate hydrolase protein [Dunaliella salina]|uniref:P-loop containing nucleoside triphosphate hydrolase protein n=1 Tax=Dunaliella salina TaxID=3046 RepID=A0ABQ7G9P3_DUNSA|nr:P-loop containing nucleoside triphosphate hydrolase protein [Dunaliella salina]|eukprot:KAF5831311.1 P-loop containing nucleoside triphosphate hydrolase protein [Dunaliella salina]
MSHCSQILELDLGALTAGCMMPGEFEERLKQVLNELAELRGRVVLFIDDIHNLVPAGGAPGATMMDGGSLLKPALSRGELRCIGASTLDKYKKTIEKDPALERRFQQVSLSLNVTFCFP